MGIFFLRGKPVTKHHFVAVWQKVDQYRGWDQAESTYLVITINVQCLIILFLLIGNSIISPLYWLGIYSFIFSLSIWFIYTLFLHQYFLGLDNHFSLSPDSLTKCLDKARNCVWICPILGLVLKPKKPHSSICLLRGSSHFFLHSLLFPIVSSIKWDQVSFHLALVIVSPTSSH